MTRVLFALLLFTLLAVITASPGASGVVSWPAGPCDIILQPGHALLSVCAGRELNLSSEDTIWRAFLLIGTVTLMRFGLRNWQKLDY